MSRIFEFKMAIILVALTAFSLHTRAETYVNLNTSFERWQISPYLTGTHFVYAVENDELYSDKRIDEWMKKAKVGTARWPGGTAVQYYHWDALNGIPFKHDSWDPEYNELAKSADKFMDVDEYLAYTKRLGIEPMIGINIRSGMKFDRLEDSLAEAKRLISHVKQTGYKVKFWYIGNEGYATGFGPVKYAEAIDRYAEVLKSVDPDIEIIGDWKFGPVKKQRFDEAVTIGKLSKHLDVMEFHEKWGVIWGLESGSTIEEWKQESPIYNGRLGEYIRNYKDVMAQLGRSDLKVALNEWGIGRVKGASEFDYRLIAADYLIEVFRNQIYQACYWNMNMGPDMNGRILNRESDDTLVKINPIGNVFELFSNAQNTSLLYLETSNEKIYGFAVKVSENRYDVYLINKSSDNERIVIGLDGKKEAYSMNMNLVSYAFPGELHSKGQRLFSRKDMKSLRLEPWSMNRVEINLN